MRDHKAKGQVVALDGMTVMEVLTIITGKRFSKALLVEFNEDVQKIREIRERKIFFGGWFIIATLEG